MKTLKAIARQPVDSSNVRSVGHDPETNRLHVEFKNGSVYEYNGVPAHEHQALVNAPSVGSYLHQHIKGYGGVRIA
jgi:hypothetical protein